MQHFGIIGYPLAHSFSAKLFSEKFLREGISAEYSMYPLASINDFPALIRRVDFTGMNVTMPYKEAVIPYLDSLDETAAGIGAVNVIHFREGADGQSILTGYNTDAIGFMNAIKPMLQDSDKNALILGTGGAAKAAVYGLRKLGLQPTLVSRDSQKGLPYSALTKEIVEAHTVIVNCTPLGMSPATDACPPFPYAYLTEKHLLYDMIYNPEDTLFLNHGKRKGCRTKCGTDMLLGQAAAAWNIWNNN